MSKYDRITPEGTRDILFEECAAQSAIMQKLKDIFENRGYREVMTPGFEFYDVFASKANYYPQENMYKFSDRRGRLVTVRPDSTIPIARMTAAKLKGAELPIRLFYAQRIYRQQPEHKGKSGEIMQMGIELIGNSDYQSDIEMLSAAADSLSAVSGAGFRMEIGHVGIYNLLMKKLEAEDDIKAAIHTYIASKNYAGLNDILDGLPQDKTAEILRRLPGLFGSSRALSEAAELFRGYDPQLTGMLDYLKRLFEELQGKGIAGSIMIDFGLVNEAEYYSSLVFRGYIETAGEPVLSGGRYDNLFADFGEDLPATGFGLNVDLLAMAYLRNAKKDAGQPETMKGSADTASSKLRIALTKGRLEKNFSELLEKAGYDLSVLRDKGRKLLIPIPGTEIEIFLAKASDVITYVEHGVCDIGIVGKDTIVEQGGNYYDIQDLGIGKCRFALAAPKGKNIFGGYGAKVIATKYPNVASAYFEGKGMDVEIIKIEGSVELAPLLDLADAIVDIVETGNTLKENGLEVVEEIRDISARLIVNVTSMKLKKEAIDEFTGKLSGSLVSQK